MTRDRPMLSTSVAADVAFGLLTSSSMQRYIRIAREAAASFGSAVSATPEEWPTVVERAARLWRQLLRSDKREPEEAELVVLLVALSRTALDGVDDLLAKVALADRQPASWVSALARTLRQERATTDVRKPEALTATTRYAEATRSITRYAAETSISRSRSALTPALAIRSTGATSPPLPRAA